MTIKLYKCLDRKNKLDKTLQNEKVITGSLKNKVSVINPTIILKRETDFNFSDYN